MPRDRITDFIRHCVPPRRLVQFSTYLLLACIPAWPITSLTVLRDEPQGVLALSWFSIILACLILVVTTEINDPDSGPS